jgi:hypothetical protein
MGGLASCCDAAGSSGALASFTCPDCGRTSYNLNDVREGYCGFCHAFTGNGALKARCAACGAPARGRLILCLDCGRPFVFAENYVERAEAAYHNDRFAERPCDNCGELYRGPAVYCSLKCALADA